MIAQPDLSSPPKTVRPSLRMMSPSTIGRTPWPGLTVSMWEHSSSGAAAGRVPGKWAIRLPTSPPTLVPALSKQHCAPNGSNSFRRRSAHSPSWRESESICTSSNNRCLSRCEFTPIIALARSPDRALLAHPQLAFDKILGCLVPGIERGAGESPLFDRNYQIAGVGIVGAVGSEGAGLAPVSGREVGVVIRMGIVDQAHVQAAVVHFAQHREVLARLHQVGGARVARKGLRVLGVLLILNVLDRPHFFDPFVAEDR